MIYENLSISIFVLFVFSVIFGITPFYFPCAVVVTALTLGIFSSGEGMEQSALTIRWP